MSIGNTKDQGNKGNNFPYQASNLKLLGSILLGVTPPGGLMTEATGNNILSALNNGQEYEGTLVVDAANIMWLEVRVWNTTTHAFDPPVYYQAGTNVPGIPTAPTTYINPNTLLATIASNTTGINLEATQILLKNLLTTIDGDTSNLDVALSTRSSETTLLLVKGVLDNIKTNSDTLVTNSTLNRNIQFANDTITKSPSGALLASSPNILFDGKTVNIDDTSYLWESIGSGTFAWANNKMNMTVAAGQYCIRQSKRWIPYFSGYPLIVEETFDTMSIQADVTKRIGYFSSSAVAPYDTSYDGFWFEMSAGTYHLKAARNGTLTVNVPFASWSGFSLLSGYDFSDFSAIYFDFLWLGGAALRIWVCTPDQGWVLGHSAQYIGNNQDIIILSPYQPLRYEIVSTVGTGSLRQICSQASALGDFLTRLGNSSISINTASIACNAVGTVYALQGFKKNATYRNIPIKFSSFGCVNGATTDTGLLMIVRNPTLSAPLTYGAYGKVDRAIATNQTVTVLGDIIGVVGVGTVSANEDLLDNYKAWLTQSIANTFDEYVLCYLSASANQDIRAYAYLKEY